MKFKFDPRAGRMVGSRTQSLQRHEIERLGGVIPDNRHISPGTAYIPEKDVMRVKAAARRDGVEVTRLNDYDKDIGGGLYRFEKTTTFESEKDMKKLNEKSKVTLTMKQLKKLVKENIANEGKKVNEGTIDADLCSYMKDEIALFLKKKYGTFQYNMRIGDSLKVEAKGSSIWISIAPNKYGWKTLLILAESVLKERGMAVMDHHVWDGEKDDNGNPVVTLEVEVYSNEVEPVTEEFDTEDGWDCDEIRDSGLLDTLRKCANLQYTLDKCTRASANFGETLGDLKAYVNELAEEMQNAVASFPDEDEEDEFQGQDAMGDDEEIEVMERIGDTVSDADVRELVLYITNDSGLYHRYVEPIIANLRKKVKKGIYNPELAVKLWKVLADEGAKKYDKELNDGRGRVDWLNVPTRLAIAKELRDYYQERVDAVDEVSEGYHADSPGKRMAVGYARELERETGNRNFAILTLCDTFGDHKVIDALANELDDLRHDAGNLPF